MRNLTIAALGAGLLAIGATANAQPVIVGGSGPAQPPPGSGNSAQASALDREAQAAYNQRVGSQNLTSNSDHRKTQPKAVPATAADIKAGAALRDINGVAIGTIVSVDANQAVVDTGQTKIGVPVIAFGKDDKGLLLGMTAEKFNQLVAAAHAKSQAASN
jgi:hypothetical protein